MRGHPYSYGCNIILTCDPGLVFPDGLHVWNLTRLAVPYPNTVVWVPTDKPKPICKGKLLHLNQLCLFLPIRSH